MAAFRLGLRNKILKTAVVLRCQLLVKEHWEIS